MRSALRGMEARGLAGGLTGPVVRADTDVIAAHLRALPEQPGAVYRLLSLQALRLAGARLAPEARTSLTRLLQGPRRGARR